MYVMVRGPLLNYVWILIDRPYEKVRYRKR